MTVRIHYRAKEHGMMYVEVEVPELTKDCVMIYAEVLPDAASEEQ